MSMKKIIEIESNNERYLYFPFIKHFYYAKIISSKQINESLTLYIIESPIISPSLYWIIVKDSTDEDYLILDIGNFKDVSKSFKKLVEELKYIKDLKIIKVLENI